MNERENIQENREKALQGLIPALLEWYPQVRRDLPWRVDPTPYHVWISEIMLQQTRIEAVKGYYARFLAYFPELKDLAEASEQTVLKAWEGLGYYSRARNLQRAAKVCVEQYGGELPGDYEKLKSLPGIGSYTAGAVGSIAFQLPVPAVDGNVLRVLARYLADDSDIGKAGVKTGIERMLLPILPETGAGDFNQAIMELGETICIPNGKPLCGQCPLKGGCIAYREGSVEAYPVKSKKKERRIQNMTVLLLRHKDTYGVRRRPSKGLLADLYEFPWLPEHRDRREMESWIGDNIPGGRILRELPPAKHIFSHVEWHMIGWEVELCDLPKKEFCEFHTVVQLHREYPIPVAMKKYDEYLTL